MRSPGARKALGRPKRHKSARAFLRERSDKRLKLAQLLGQLGVFSHFDDHVLAGLDLLAAAERRHCPGRKSPFLAVKRPARSYKTAIENLFTYSRRKTLRPLKRPGRPGQVLVVAIVKRSARRSSRISPSVARTAARG